MQREEQILDSILPTKDPDQKNCVPLMRGLYAWRLYGGRCPSFKQNSCEWAKPSSRCKALDPRSILDQRVGFHWVFFRFQMLLPCPLTYSMYFKQSILDQGMGSIESVSVFGIPIPCSLAWSMYFSQDICLKIEELSPVWDKRGKKLCSEHNTSLQQSAMERRLWWS